jgi:ABC-type Fe3+/spermidine/putrescine transport system ATPase subunit
MAEPLLELRDVRASYGKIEVLHGVDLVVPQGSVVALLGPNGGGKTTTLKVASGQMVPTAGCVHVGGRHVNGAPADALARLGLCTIPEGRGIFPNLTVRENLRMATFGGIGMDEVDGLTDRGDAAVEHDGGVVGHAEDGAGELLDDEDRHALLGDLGDDLVELLDDDRRQPHRQLVEQQQGRVDGQASRKRQHLLLAARQGPRQL